ncbi:MAG: Ltp family lipoprotein [Candidatus Saccharimonadales bacterium]
MSKDKKENWFSKHKILTGIIAIVALIILVSALSDGESATENTAPNDTTTSEQQVENVTEEEKADESVPAEYKSALSKATSYANTMHMSKAGVFDQLTSEYGEKFSQEAAQYGIDNVKADWNENALKKAKNYQETMSMSPAAIRDQLVSEHGEKFTPEEADYAMQRLNS